MVQDLIGLEIPLLMLMQTFGFFVAIGFLVSHYTLYNELERKSKAGLLAEQITKETIGKKIEIKDLLPNIFFGLLLGYKVVYFALEFDLVKNNPQDAILSTKGNLLGGILVAAGVGYYTWRQAKKKELPEPKEVEVKQQGHHHTGNITLIAAVCGIIGAKLFHILEYIDDFMADPIGSIFAFSGLTFFGGLICGGIGAIWYASKKGIHWRHMLDAGAPTMMLGYAVGRIGCHMSGDGDWGIINNNPKPGWLNWLPDWAWSYNYPNNVIHQCNPYSDERQFQMVCDWSETPYLIEPVYPTPFYEVLMCLALFGVIMALRKRIKIPGALFAIYMIMSGLERFLIEKIRVNSNYIILGQEITQAELISGAMMLVGAVWLIYLFVKKPPVPLPESSNMNA